mmetsp:Transcript_4530/g.11604  ORF Transcript_4530/g.11604 Transcript_4530/m.11604 type:complete len:436 (-) Transcript_4530:81-1388(-)
MSGRRTHHVVEHTGHGLGYTATADDAYPQGAGGGLAAGRFATHRAAVAAAAAQEGGASSPRTSRSPRVTQVEIPDLTEEVYNSGRRSENSMTRGTVAQAPPAATPSTYPPRHFTASPELAIPEEEFDGESETRSDVDRLDDIDWSGPVGDTVDGGLMWEPEKVTKFPNRDDEWFDSGDASPIPEEVTSLGADAGAVVDVVATAARPFGGRLPGQPDDMHGGERGIDVAGAPAPLRKQRTGGRISRGGKTPTMLSKGSTSMTSSTWKSTRSTPVKRVKPFGFSKADKAWTELGHLEVEPYSQASINRTNKMSTREIQEREDEARGPREGPPPTEKPKFVPELPPQKKQFYSRLAEPRKPVPQEVNYPFKPTLTEPSKKTWKKHGHKKGFDPTAYAQQRKAAIEQANLARWQPTQWSAVPSSCYKPSADAHHNGEWD